MSQSNPFDKDKDRFIVEIPPKSPPQKPALEPAKKPASVAKSAGIISLAVMASRVLGLVREIIFNSLFGASASYASDAFLMAFRIPNLLRDLFAEGALSSAFVTVFADYQVTKGEKAAFRLSNLVMNALLLILGILVILGIIFAPQIVNFFASGYKSVPGKFELTVRMTRLMMPFILLVAMAAQAMGLLNSRNRFAIPALSSSFFNVGSILGGVFLAILMSGGSFAHPIQAVVENPLDGIIGMTYGVLIGGFLQLAIQLPSLHREGYRYRPLLSFRDEGVRRIFALMAPAVIGAAAVQINVLINSNFATSIPGNGAVSWLNSAFRLMQFPLGMFGVAIATATVPAISKNAALKEVDGFRKTLASSIRLVFLLTIPSAVGLLVLGQPIIALIYERGAFRSADTTHTAAALAFYAVGLAGYSAIKVLAPAFYALNDARTPMKISLLSIVVNFVMNWALVGVMEERGLALSTAVVALLNFALLYWIMQRRINGIEGRKTFATVIKITLAATVMGVVCWLVSKLCYRALGDTQLARLLNVMASVLTGAIVFCAVATLLKVRELSVAFDAIGGRIMKKLKR